MKLPTKKSETRPPLRTVSEIAESLGITQQALQQALCREDAPKPRVRGSEMGHRKAGRVWYEPREVVSWFRALPQKSEEDRKEKLRQYYQANAQKILQQQREYRQRLKNKTMQISDNKSNLVIEEQK